MEYLRQQVFKRAQHKDIQEYLQNVLSEVAAHDKVFRNLLTSKFDLELMDMFKKAMHEDFERMLKDFNVAPETLPGPIELVSLYYATGTTSVLLYWLKDNLRHSIDEVRDCLVGLLPLELLGMPRP